MNCKPSIQTIALIALGFLYSCSEQQEGAESVSTPEPVAVPTGISIVSESTKPWLITGGDGLFRIDLEDTIDIDGVTVSVNGESVTEDFRRLESGSLSGLITGLMEGKNIIEARAAGAEEAEILEVYNFPITGPIISGPHESPFICQTRDFLLVNGTPLGNPTDENCSVDVVISYMYLSSESGEFKPFRYYINGGKPADIADVALENGESRPFIVRVETGTVNRAIYEIAMLHDPKPSEPVSIWSRSKGWNGKLVYTHGGGCRSGWNQQGDRTGGVLREGLLRMGYAVASSTLNVFAQNCNDLLASETHIMVKERFIEHYGVPEFTIGTGGSGGSYQSHQTADNYPGVFDGIIVSSSFPDVTSATIFTLADSRLLNYYFNDIAKDEFSQEQQRAVSGFGKHGSIANLARGAARLDPMYRFDTPAEEAGGEFSLPILETSRYHPSIPGGLRGTVYDHTINVYDKDLDTGFANRPLDNVGVQYGLAALNQGKISNAQFIQLNRDIGGFDVDMNHIPERHSATGDAAERAIGSGRILYGGAGLASTPVIDYRSYRDAVVGGDIHMKVHQYSTRERMINANGHADNHIMTVGGKWGFTEESPDLGNLFAHMDNWLSAIKNDGSDTDPSVKVVNNKPAGLVDNCWDNRAEKRINIAEPQTYNGAGICNELYPAFPTPRHVAGAPLANDVVSCELKEFDPDDYTVSFTDDEVASLKVVFPQGVCDWTSGDKTGTDYFSTWASFGPSPVNWVPWVPAGAVRIYLD